MQAMVLPEQVRQQIPQLLGRCGTKPAKPPGEPTSQDPVGGIGADRSWRHRGSGVRAGSG